MKEPDEQGKPVRSGYYKVLVRRSNGRLYQFTAYYYRETGTWSTNDTVLIWDNRHTERFLGNERKRKIR